MSNPKVTVILSSYNHADFIGRSIESILNQSFKDFELLIIDDASTDDSWKVIKSYKDPRIIAIRNKKNLALTTRPEVINKARGEYIAIAHCDDEWGSKKLEKQVDFLDKNPEYAACFTLVKLIDEESNEFLDKSHAYYGVFDQKNRSRLEWLKKFFYDGNCLCHPSVLLRKRAQVDYSLYAQGCKALPDGYRWIKLCLHENIYILQEKLTKFRIRKNEGNTSGDKIDNIIRLNFERFALLDCYKETLKYSEKDFLTVFPTAKKFRNDNESNNLEYLLARTLVDCKGNSPYQLYGLKMLWDIFRDDAKKKAVEEEYGFTHKDLTELTGTIDIFNNQDPSNTLSSILYYDTGDGFKNDHSISKSIYINKQHKFYVEFVIQTSRKISQILFNPTQNQYITFKNLKIISDDKELAYSAQNSIIENGEIKFNTHNPQIIASGQRIKKKIQISGEIAKRDYNEIDKLINKTSPIKRIARKAKRILTKHH